MGIFCTFERCMLEGTPVRKNPNIFGFSLANSYLCRRKPKHVRIMTAIQLRAELFREMSPLLDSEAAMTKVIAFVKGLVIAQKKEAGIAPRDGWAAAAMQAHADGEDKLMADDVFEDEKMEDWKW
jgi:hypothetical protein